MPDPQKVLDWWTFLQVSSPTLLISVASAVVAVVLVTKSLLAKMEGSFTELGKVEARLKSLDSILEEVRATTKAQESIKQQLSGDWWERQNRWNEKKNIYAGLMKGFIDLKDAYSDLGAVIKFQAEQSSNEDIVSVVANEQINNALTRIDQIRSEIGQQLALAQLFLDSRINLAVWKFYQHRPQTNLHDGSWIDPVQANINETMEGIVRVAKEDLRLTTPES